MEAAAAAAAILASLLFTIQCTCVVVEGRAFFVFGDSLVDSGNNNYLATTARADASPYGIDYPNHLPTGRFSNGLNIPDLISQSIGASASPLPCLSPDLDGSNLLIGANFASAGVGILNDTGVQFINIIRIGQQLEYFRQYQARVSAMIGANQAARLVNTALVLITLGGNDFVNNYYLVPYSVRSRQYPVPNYVRLLISEYQKILLTLHALGARRVLVTGAGPLGCAPAELSRTSNGECSPELQRASALYDQQLTQMLTGLNSRLRGNVFISANTQLMRSDFIRNPGAFGFQTSKVACCGQGAYNGVGLCTQLSNLCPDRNVYAFWDAFHPTERASRFIVRQMMTGSSEYMQPMNLSTIMALDSMT